MRGIYQIKMTYLKKAIEKKIMDEDAKFYIGKCRKCNQFVALYENDLCMRCIIKGETELK